MNRVHLISALLLLFLLLFGHSAFAADATITKDEWAAMMQDENFATAEQKLAKAYKEAMATLPEDGKQKLRAEQRAWAVSRDKEAFSKFGKGTQEYARFIIDESRVRTAALTAYTMPKHEISNPVPSREKLRVPDCTGTKKAVRNNDRQTLLDRSDFATVKQLAERGDVQAQTTLGSMYCSGDGAPKDEHLGFSWFQKAADQGYIEAQLRLARLSYPDNAKQLYWYQKAIDQCDAKAQLELGSLYFGGQLGVVDKQKGLALYLAAANQGFPEAQNLLGLSYFIGLDVPVDKKEGCRWWRTAAEQGWKSAIDSYNKNCAK